MKNMKIVIKCKDLCVRTRDLGMGLSILNRMANHGVMGRFVMSNRELDKNTVLIKHVVERGDNTVSKSKKKYKKGYRSTHNDWTPEENRIVCDRLDRPSRAVTSNGTLTKRHTKQAIKTRLSMIKSGKLERMNKDQAKDIKTYLGTLTTNASAVVNDDVNIPVKIKRVPWNHKEISAIRNHPSMAPKELASLPELRNRTVSKISQKKHEIKKMDENNY